MKYLIASLLLAISSAASAQTLPRPKQFVMISFDGSYSHPFWQESLDLAEKTNSRFTYFISGVYFLKRHDKDQYLPPRHKPGKSDIGFGDDDNKDIPARTEYVWKALKNGYDIGSHVNGHFDGGAWNKEEWTSEFSQFHSLVENVFKLYPSQAPFAPEWAPALHKAVTGFRAPLLAENLATQQVLKDFNYTYDASQTQDGRWPKQMNTGVWNLGLSTVSLIGTARRSVGMDYNILYGQCNGKFNPKNNGECSDVNPATLKYFENQTYYSYINIFLKSYYGNRAPVSIGHHFSLWNQGIYWKAMQRFVYAVCTQPEVQCVTHKEMVGWLEDVIKTQGPNVLNKLNQGQFDKTNIPREPGEKLKFEESDLKKVSFGQNLLISEITDSSERVMLKGDLPGAHLGESNDLDMGPFRIKPSQQDGKL